MGAASETAVLMLDDAHRVSPTEAVELRQLVLDGRLRSILGSTAVDSLPEPLDWLWRSRQIDRIDLEPLTSGDIAEWITT